MIVFLSKYYKMKCATRKQQFLFSSTIKTFINTEIGKLYLYESKIENI